MTGRSTSERLSRLEAHAKFNTGVGIFILILIGLGAVGFVYFWINYIVPNLNNLNDLGNMFDQIPG